MRIIVDLDGTICTEEEYHNRILAQPLKKAVSSINKLYNEGHTIIIYSSRSWQQYDMTLEWLKNYGLKYHQLYLGKPIGEVWLDDRAIRFNKWDTVMKKIERLNSKTRKVKLQNKRSNSQRLVKKGE